MRFPTIEHEEQLAQLVKRLGFLPFFKSAVPGFSVEEQIAPEFWFPQEGEGVWEWKGPAIQLSGCAYGKYFQNKAVFISREWFPDFVNYRRDGYDFDARYEDGLANLQIHVKPQNKKVGKFLEGTRRVQQIKSVSAEFLRTG